MTGTATAPAGAEGALGMSADHCGEPAMLRQAATAWRTMCDRLGQAQNQLSTCAGNLAAQWQGSSAQGFQGWYGQTAGQCTQDVDRMGRVPAMLDDLAGQAEHGNQQVCAAQTTAMGMSMGGGFGGMAPGPGGQPAAPQPGTGAAPADPMGMLQPILAQLGQALAALAQALRTLHGSAPATPPTPDQPRLEATGPVGECGQHGADAHGSDGDGYGGDGSDGDDGDSDDGDGGSDGDGARYGGGGINLGLLGGG